MVLERMGTLSLEIGFRPAILYSNHTDTTVQTQENVGATVKTCPKRKEMEAMAK
jgi:hypothetical protein